jgi:WD40 repeat protein
MKFTPHKESLTSKLFRSGLMALILLCCLNINAEEDPDKPILVPQTGHAFPIVSQDVERRYKYLFTADARGNIKKWDIASGKLMRNMHTSQPSIDKIKMLKGVSNSAGRNQMLIYSNQTNSIEIIDYAADTLITKFAWNDNLLAGTCIPKTLPDSPRH